MVVSNYGVRPSLRYDVDIRERFDGNKRVGVSDVLTSQQWRNVAPLFVLIGDW